MTSNKTQEECLRCGTCCRKGGPALHRDDVDLFHSGTLGAEDLITIRAGEIAYHPARDDFTSIENEIVKINGRQGDWICRFLFESDMGCAIYGNRPRECRLLKCWDTAELVDYLLKETLCRDDLIPGGSPLAAMAKEHEKLFPCRKVIELAESLQEKVDVDVLGRINEFIRADLLYRDRQIRAHLLRPEHEMFVLGRPLFIVLKPQGIRIIEKAGDITTSFHAGQKH